MTNNLKIAFFGTPDYAVIVLDELKNSQILPSLIITTPDRPARRGLALTSPPAKIWAEKNNIPVLQPEKLDADFAFRLSTLDFGLGVVVAYGKIIPESVIEIFSKGILNIHPSLLPKYRGPSPLSVPILAGDTETGVTIMQLDSEMDHGPILAQEPHTLSGNENANELGEILFKKGGEILSNILNDFALGKITTKEQVHSMATITKKVVKEDGEINISGDAILNWRKFRAYDGWPGIYFFQNGKRIKITDAELVDGKFVIKKVIPEGKKEILFEEWRT